LFECAAIWKGVEFVVTLCFAVVDFCSACENFVINQFGQKAGDIGARYFDRLDLLGDVTLFISQELPQLTVAADQVLAL